MFLKSIFRKLEREKGREMLKKTEAESLGMRQVGKPMTSSEVDAIREKTARRNEDAIERFIRRAEETVEPIIYIHQDYLADNVTKTFYLEQWKEADDKLLKLLKGQSTKEDIHMIPIFERYKEYRNILDDMKV